MFWPGCKIYESSFNQFHLPKGEFASYHQEFFFFICLRQLTLLNMAIFLASWDQNQLFSLIFLSKLEFFPNDCSQCCNFFKSLWHFCMNIQKSIGAFELWQILNNLNISRVGCRIQIAQERYPIYILLHHFLCY